MSELVTLTINERQVKVPKGTTVYTAAKEAGIEVPIFCYHDRMPPFGACRMCLVEVEGIPKLQTSCTLEVREGMVVKTASKRAKEGQEGIIELLLINHPLDCPICDKGGECPLQDQTLKYGPGISRFFETKRQFKKPLALGPVLMLDRERCIICARCTRFGEIVARDHALEFIDRGYGTEVGTFDGGPAQSKFIGNTISICPVGALTSQAYRFKARPWDNTSVKSTCTLCPVGCSMTLDSRDGEILRTRFSENKDVNDVWLCDKGWFGYQFAESSERLTTPLIKRNGHLEPASWEEAFNTIVSHLNQALPTNKVAAFGGLPLTFEENFLFQALMRGLGVNNLDYRIGLPIFSLEEEYLPEGMGGPIIELETVKTVAILGCDITEEFPLLWLRMNKTAELTFIGHYAPEMYAYCKELILHAPGEELEHIKKMKKPEVIIVGSQYLHMPHRREILKELHGMGVKLHILGGAEGSVGARESGMHPELGPFGKRIEKPGLNALQVMEQPDWEFLWVAGANPARKFANFSRKHLKFLVVQDLFMTETAELANVVLPTLSFIEKEGTFLNIEHRAQKLKPGKAIPEGVLSDRAIFVEIAKRFKLAMPEKPHAMEFMQRTPVLSTSSLKLETSKGLKVSYARILFDRGERMRRNTQLIGMSKDPKIRMHPEEAKKRGLTEGTLVNVGPIQGLLKTDRNVALGTLVLPLGFPELPVEKLGHNYLNGYGLEVTHGS